MNDEIDQIEPAYIPMKERICISLLTAGAHPNTCMGPRCNLYECCLAAMIEAAETWEAWCHNGKQMRHNLIHPVRRDR